MCPVEPLLFYLLSAINCEPPTLESEATYINNTLIIASTSSFRGLVEPITSVF